MTLAEFKAWFEGFTEDMDGPPNAKQFKRIKAKVGEITGAPITQTVIREYVDRYRPYWYSSMNDVMIGGKLTAYSTALSTAGQNGTVGEFFNSTVEQPTIIETESGRASILHDLGKAEYQSLQAL